MNSERRDEKRHHEIGEIGLIDNTVLRLLFESNPLAILITDSNEKILSVNPAFEGMSGYSKYEAIGQTPRMFSSGRHTAEFYSAMWKAIHTDGEWHGEIWDRRPNGECYPKRMVIKRLVNARSETTHYISMSSDITREFMHQEKIWFLSHHDVLTELPNRFLFSDRLTQAIAWSRRGGDELAVLCIGIDRFKFINETYGHRSGDQILKALASRLGEMIGDGGILCRHDGDQFLVLLDQISSLEAIGTLAQQILGSLSRPLRLEEIEISIAVSIGISTFPHDADSESGLIQQADCAMRHAKDQGGNRSLFFSRDINDTSRLQLDLERDLRESLLQNEHLFMVYQPKYSLENDQIVGFEALVRWSHPVHGQIPPDAFIPLAEEARLINRLGDWIFKEVLVQMSRWQSSSFRSIPVAINVSPSQLKDEEFISRSAALCDSYGVSRSSVEFEITENVFIGNAHRAKKTLQSIKNAGFKLALDDFGTGFSSFSYLASLPWDVVKIDRSFIADLGKNPKSNSILKAIIALSNELGLDLVAEGVETPEQHQWLAKAGCGIGQGYFYSRPHPANVLLQNPLRHIHATCSKWQMHEGSVHSDASYRSSPGL